jgi:hypothetical protein
MADKKVITDKKGAGNALDLLDVLLQKWAEEQKQKEAESGTGSPKKHDSPVQALRVLDKEEPVDQDDDKNSPIHKRRHVRSQSAFAECLQAKTLEALERRRKSISSKFLDRLDGLDGIVTDT